MSRRSWFKDSQTTGQGLVFVDCSFVTNNTSDPATATLRGFGGLTGGAGAGVANSGPSAIASVTRTGVGSYLITLADGYRAVQSKFAEIEDAADNLLARCGTVSNEGSGHTTAVTVAVVVRNASTGAATESTSRRISVALCLKDSGNGT